MVQPASSAGEYFCVICPHLQLSESVLGLAKFLQTKQYSFNPILCTFRTYLPVSVYLNFMSQ